MKLKFELDDKGIPMILLFIVIVLIVIAFGATSMSSLETTITGHASAKALDKMDITVFSMLILFVLGALGIILYKKGRIEKKTKNKQEKNKK